MFNSPYLAQQAHGGFAEFTTAGAWFNFNRPPGANFIQFFLVGAGGGGGGGSSGSSLTLRSGGGGGGSGAMTRILVPAYLLPDRFYVKTGAGGAGGAAGNTGTNGGDSTIALHPTTNASDLFGSGKGGSGGAAGNAGTPGTGGNQGQVTTNIQNMWLNLCEFVSNTGTAGGAGGTTTGTTISPLTNSLTTPGAGGGAATTSDSAWNGGAISALDPWLPTAIAAGVAGASAAGNPGCFFKKPFYSIAGSGGGGNGTGTGGVGGKAFLGSGGGGGGGGLTGGAGGLGGDGYILISWW